MGRDAGIIGEDVAMLYLIRDLVRLWGSADLEAHALSTRRLDTAEAPLYRTFFGKAVGRRLQIFSWLQESGKPSHLNDFQQPKFASFRHNTSCQREPRHQLLAIASGSPAVKLSEECWEISNWDTF